MPNARRYDNGNRGDNQPHGESHSKNFATED